jgi:hypothetical protein
VIVIASICAYNRAYTAGLHEVLIGLDRSRIDESLAKA